MLNLDDMSAFQNFFNEDVFNNNDEIHNFHPNNFRLEFKNELC